MAEKRCLKAFQEGRKEDSYRFLTELPYELVPRIRNDEDDDGYTLLHYAAKWGWLDIAKLLVEKYHCSIDTCGDNLPGMHNHPYDSLSFAIEFGHRDIAQYMAQILYGKISAIILTNVEAEKSELVRQLQMKKEQHDIEKKEMVSQLNEQKMKLEQHNTERKELEIQLEAQKKQMEQYETEKKELELQLEEQKKRLVQDEAEKKELELQLEEQKKRLVQDEAEKKELEEQKSEFVYEQEKMEQKVPSQQEGYETVKKPLSITDLCEGLEATADVQELWEELGLVLGLDRAVLSAISLDHPSILHHHYEIMKHWIKNGEASWEKLVDALRSPLLNEIQVSKDIVEKYLDKEGKSSIPIHKVSTEDKQLKDTDLSDILKATSQCVSWKVLGLMLGISDNVLEHIQSSHSSPEKCQQSMLEHWIKTGQAYWSVLVDTLKSPLLREDEVAEEISKTYLKTTVATINQPATTEEISKGVFCVGMEDVKKMKQKIRNLYKENQDAQGIAFIIGIHGPAGTDVDIENVSSTFRNDLKFAVWRERDLTCADLACLAKAAASHMYPNYKYLAFYFAGHGGIDANERSFVVLMKLRGEESQQILYIEENILSCFQNVRKRCIFFFDCCLSGRPTEDSKSTQAGSLPSKGDQNSPPKRVFKLRAPVKCLVAYATATGLKSQGDKVYGGLWTHNLCEKLKEPLSLSDILDQTHDIVVEKVKGEQPPHYESCLGAVYLKGISEKTYQEYIKSTIQLISQDKEDQVETVKDQVKKESHSQIEERLEQLLLEMKSMKQYQLEMKTDILTSIKERTI